MCADSLYRVKCYRRSIVHALIYHSERVSKCSNRTNENGLATTKDYDWIKNKWKIKKRMIRCSSTHAHRKWARMKNVNEVSVVRESETGDKKFVRTELLRACTTSHRCPPASKHICIQMKFPNLVNAVIVVDVTCRIFIWNHRAGPHKRINSRIKYAQNNKRHQDWTNAKAL